MPGRGLRSLLGGLTAALVGVTLTGCVRVEDPPPPTAATTTTVPAALGERRQSSDPARTSSNGWTRQREPLALSEDAAPRGRFTALLRDPRGGVLAVGRVDDPAGSRLTTWYSPDGSTWEEEPVAGGDWITPIAAAASGDTVVILGARGRRQQAVAAGFVRRASGAFEAVSLPPSLTVSAPLGLAGGPAGFVAVAVGQTATSMELEIITSTDGSSWVQADTSSIEMADRGGRGSDAALPVAVGQRGAVVALPGSGAAPDDSSGGSAGSDGGSDRAGARIIVSTDLRTFRPVTGGPSEDDDISGIAMSGDDPVVFGLRTPDTATPDGTDAGDGADAADPADAADAADAVDSMSAQPVRWVRRDGRWSRATLSARLPEAATVTTEPVTTEPVTTEPVTTDPATTDPVTTDPATTGPATTADPADLSDLVFAVTLPRRLDDRWFALLEVAEADATSVTLGTSEDGIRWEVAPLPSSLDVPDLLAVGAIGGDERPFLASSTGPTWVLGTRSGLLQSTPGVGLPAPVAEVRSVSPLVTPGGTTVLIGTVRPGRPSAAPSFSTTVAVASRGSVRRVGEIPQFLVTTTGDGATPIAAGATRIAADPVAQTPERVVAAIATSARGREWTTEVIELGLDPEISSVALRADTDGETTMALVLGREGIDGPEIGRAIARRETGGQWAMVDDGLAMTDEVSDLCRAGDEWFRLVGTATGFRVDASADGLDWSPRPVTGAAEPMTVATLECGVVGDRPVFRVTDPQERSMWLTPVPGSDELAAFDPIGDPAVAVALPSASLGAAGLRLQVPTAVEDPLFLLTGRGPRSASPPRSGPSASRRRCATPRSSPTERPPSPCSSWTAASTCGRPPCRVSTWSPSSRASSIRPPPWPRPTAEPPPTPRPATRHRPTRHPPTRHRPTPRRRTARPRTPRPRTPRPRTRPPTPSSPPRPDAPVARALLARSLAHSSLGHRSPGTCPDVGPPRPDHRGV